MHVYMKRVITICINLNLRAYNSENIKQTTLNFTVFVVFKLLHFNICAIMDIFLTKYMKFGEQIRTP